MRNCISSHDYRANQDLGPLPQIKLKCPQLFILTAGILTSQTDLKTHGWNLAVRNLRAGIPSVPLSLWLPYEPIDQSLFLH